MSKKRWNMIGWVLLIGMIASWMGVGYSKGHLLLLPLVYVCFSMQNNGSPSIRKVVIILVAFLLAVGSVFGLIQIAHYMIHDWLQLTGWLQTVSQILTLIVILYPVMITLQRFVYKVNVEKSK